MITKKQKSLTPLKVLHLFIFILGAMLVTPTHIFSQPHFMPLRFPHYLEMMEPFLRISWPLTFEIYHYVLLALAIILSINVLGIFFYPKFKQMAIASSLAGLFLISSLVLFFFFVFIHVNTSTAIIYGIYCVVLLIVNFLTFKTLIAGFPLLRE